MAQWLRATDLFYYFGMYVIETNQIPWFRGNKGM